MISNIWLSTKNIDYSGYRQIPSRIAIRDNTLKTLLAAYFYHKAVQSVIRNILGEIR